MITKWRRYLVFRQLSKVYGEFTALAMMEDALKVNKDISQCHYWEESSLGGIVAWSDTNYPEMWEYACTKLRSELYKPM